MADAAVENPANVVPPHLKLSSKTLTNLDSVDVLAGEGTDEYSTYKKLQRELEYINLQEEYIKDEQRCVPTCIELSDHYSTGCRSLKRELVRAQEEIKRIQSVPLVIGQFMEAIDQKWVMQSFHSCYYRLMRR